MDAKRTAIIIGAGPAGLTAAYELLARTDVTPIVLEKSSYMGGISRTVNYKGNRIDIGGHRFFSKSDRVMDWWLSRLPIQNTDDPALQITYQNQRRNIAPAAGADPSLTDRLMLVRRRRSRIYFRRKFFNYPLSLSVQTLRQLGLWQTFRIGLSYLKSTVFPIRNEQNLEQFFINRFGRVLYETFFKSYTEKVWGVPCDRISAEWGAQRVKGLSIRKALAHVIRQTFASKDSIHHKDVETSLIEQFLYPKFGPGQMWEETAREVIGRGGQILTGWTVDKLISEPGRVTEVQAVHESSGERRTFSGDYVFSTMPIVELIDSMEPQAPAPVKEVATGLVYRDFMTVGLLCRKLTLTEPGTNGRERAKDNWIYIQDPDAQVGRLQIFNNWSPFLVGDPDLTWIGLEYFCNEGDALWRQTDEELTAFAKEEMEKLAIVDADQVVDATVIRMAKTYPAYFGSYDRFIEIRKYVDPIENLFLIGRNGMHKYNNQDHSMLTAMIAVDNIVAGVTGKENLWSVNTEQEYGEEKKA